MGIELGKNLLEAKAENKKGFWEDKELVSINIEMMKLNGQDWHTFGSIDKQNDNELIIKASNYLKNQHSKSRVWGFKDPRTTRLVKFWELVVSKVESDAYYCVVIRHPLSVMKSLESRNSFSNRRAVLLWYVYYMDMLVSLKGKSFTVVDYDYLIANAKDEVCRIAKGMKQDDKLSKQALNEYCEEFLSNDLRHSVFSMADLFEHKAVPKCVITLYQSLLNLSNLPTATVPDILSGVLDNWENQRLQFEDFFELINELGESEERLTVALTHVDQTLSERDSALNERNIENQRHLMALECIDSYRSDIELLVSKCLDLEKQLEAMKEKENSSLINKVKNFLK